MAWGLPAVFCLPCTMQTIMIIYTIHYNKDLTSAAHKHISGLLHTQGLATAIDEDVGVSLELPREAAA